ncbi:MULTISPECIES: hypothetical protein [unclassified Streptomyces]|uniref:hypothetical protein n=1 Tax=unclassified Streptomyces TaxID=2593676 RepID=UPI002ED32842|nr:hypothetical protein OH827_33345 [Streptomyces sp. NBC_00891]WSY09610.1 hypothetical protein OG464_33350 [Streptomyces sp. NBC_00890]WSZ11230.1 hypothetical protein OG704_33350 [Streptomyces sp. NBC_00869]WSZ21265.1 hypothetical protein OG498_00220 [Streptomyces sp. NBC_00870]
MTTTVLRLNHIQRGWPVWCSAVVEGDVFNVNEFDEEAFRAPSVVAEIDLLEPSGKYRQVHVHWALLRLQADVWR